MKERSFFWPFVMIAAGFVWLMINMGRIPAENLWALTHAWPFLLMALGVGLIVRSFSRLGGRLLSLLIVLAAVFAIIYAPQMGWTTPQEWNSIRFDIGSDFSGGVPGSGVIVAETREVSHFTGVDIRYPAVVVIQPGLEDSIRIETDDNLLSQLTAKVQTGILVFDNSVSGWQKRVDPSDKILVTITVTELTSVNFPSAGQLTINGVDTPKLDLTVSGAGSMVLKDVKIDAFKAKLSGAGSIDAEGSGESLDINISGAGSFNGGDFKVNTAEASISGVGSATIWVEKDLQANISGIGSIYYYGAPSVDQHVSGLGNVHSLGSK